MLYDGALLPALFTRDGRLRGEAIVELYEVRPKGRGGKASHLQPLRVMGSCGSEKGAQGVCLQPYSSESSHSTLFGRLSCPSNPPRDDRRIGSVRRIELVDANCRGAFVFPSF